MRATRACSTKSAAKAAGVDINVVREPNDGYWDNVWMKKAGASVLEWPSDRGLDVRLGLCEDAEWNETNWANPKFNELLVKAARGPNYKKRAAMYAEMQQLCHDDCGALVLVFNNYVDASSKKLAHNKVSGQLGKAMGSRSPSGGGSPSVRALAHGRAGPTASRPILLR